MAKNSRRLELGPANIYLITLPRASVLVLGYPDPDNGVFLQSVRPGAGFDSSGNPVDYSGDDITIQYVNDISNPATPTVVITDTDIVVNIDAGVTTANQVIAALTEDLRAAYFVTAAKAVGGDGTSAVVATAVIPLTGGAGPSVRTDVGYLGDAVMFQVTTEAASLTGAQAGNTPLDKVVIGGMVKVVIPFKEISLDNLRIGVPSARVVENEDNSRRRVDFIVAVGASMRQQLSLRMEIIKIKGGFESPLAADRIIIPEISPAEGEVNFPFAPVTQREIMTNWYAWPNDVTGRWAIMGDELP